MVPHPALRPAGKPTTASATPSGRFPACPSGGARIALICTWLVAAAVAVAAAAERPPLVDAARNADRDALRRLLQEKADVNAAEGDGTTALHWASYRDDHESASLLLRAGARVNAANDLGATPLWLASQNGSVDMVRRLLEGGADPNLALLAGETPLMVGARAGKADVVDLLAAKGADVNARASRDQTALMWAVAQKHPGVVTVLLARGADVHARSAVWSQVMAVPPHGMLEYNRDIPHGGDTPLLFAARSGDLASARLLVDAGANVNDADAWGISALALAAHSGYRELVEFLLDKGADPNADAPGFTALQEAVMRRDEQMAAALLARGADPNARLRTWTPTRRSSRDWNFGPEHVGATPFWLAARFAEPGLMRLLLKHGADPLFVHRASYHAGDPATPRSDTTTALMAATGMGGGAAWVRPTRVEPQARMLEAVKLAVELGIDVNAANTDGRTALDAAQAANYQSVVAFLVEHGAKPGSGRPGQARPPTNR
jgi:ankyrin repeat protein